MVKIIYWLEHRSKKKKQKRILKNILSNAVFGKTMENVKKQGDIRLTKTGKKKKLFGIRTK